MKEFPGPTADTSARTLALAEFQKKILRHALRFPKLQRLAYSTCSVFRQVRQIDRPVEMNCLLGYVELVLILLDLIPYDR